MSFACLFLKIIKIIVFYLNFERSLLHYGFCFPWMKRIKLRLKITQEIFEPIERTWKFICEK